MGQLQHELQPWVTIYLGVRASDAQQHVESDVHVLDQLTRVRLWVYAGG